MNSKFKILIVSALLPTLFFGCSTATSTNSDDTNGAATQEETANVQPKVAAVDYAKDWEDFKAAVIKKDLKGVEKFFKNDELSAQGLVDLVFPDVEAALKKTTYSDLKDGDYDGTPVIQFIYEESGMDEEGNEMGMAIYFYFTKPAEGLRMIAYSAAG